MRFSFLLSLLFLGGALSADEWYDSDYNFRSREHCEFIGTVRERASASLSQCVKACNDYNQQGQEVPGKCTALTYDHETEEEDNCVLLDLNVDGPITFRKGRRLEKTCSYLPSLNDNDDFKRLKIGDDNREDNGGATTYNCAYGWKFFRENCYLIMTEEVGHLDANHTCTTEHHGHLATPLSSEENDFLFRITNQATWIGIIFDAQAHVSHINDGSIADFVQWGDYEPNLNGWNCVYVDSDMSGNKDQAALWHTINCNTKLQAVCQRPAYVGQN